MRTTKFSFYPAQPYWAIDSINLELDYANFSTAMSETVYAFSAGNDQIEFARDGQISLTRNEKNATDSTWPAIESTIQDLRSVLHHLNALNLIFTTQADKTDHFSYFHLQTVTNRDLIIEEYQDKNLLIGHLPKSNGLSYYHLRYKNLHPAGIPTSVIPDLFTRRTVSKQALDATNLSFQKAIKNDAIIHLSFLAKALSEYKSSDLDHSLVSAWFVAESILTKIYFNRLRRNKQDKSEIKIMALESNKLIGTTLADQLHKTRKKRNKIAHATMSTKILSIDAQQGIESAAQLIALHFGIDLEINYGQAVLGM